MNKERYKSSVIIVPCNNCKSNDICEAFKRLSKLFLAIDSIKIEKDYPFISIICADYKNGKLIIDIECDNYVKK